MTQTNSVKKGKVFPVQAMKEYMGSRGIALFILNSALDGDEWAASYPGHFTLLDKIPSTQ